VLDQAAGLTQVLADGTNTYLYGNGRIAQVSATGTDYFLGDALGSVRQLANASGAVTLAKSYQPYGSVMSSVGSRTSIYGWTGEIADAGTGLVYLRARFLSTYVVADRRDFIAGRRPLINTPNEMVKALTGVSASASANFLFGVGCANTLFGGNASAVVFSEGFTFGVSVNVSLTTFTGYSDPGLSWDWIMQGELNGIQRKDVEEKAAHYSESPP
jgi:hypothetical protein